MNTNTTGSVDGSLAPQTSDFSRGKRSLPPQALARKALALALAIATLAAACTLQNDVPSLERRAQEINTALMCPVCPGESIDQSQNALAGQMREIVKEKLRDGWTEGRIKDFFVERYGRTVLMAPPGEGFSLAAWVIPPLGVAAGGSALYMVLRLMRRAPAAPRDEIDEAAEPSDAELADYYRRIESALDFGDATPTGPESRPAGESGGGSGDG